MKAYQTNRSTVRRFLLDTQHLSSQKNISSSSSTTTDDVLHMIRQLECVQLDPVAAVERNQHLVLAARIPGYEPTALNHLLEQGKLFEFWANAACTIPMEDYPVFEQTRIRRQLQIQPELEKYEPVVKDVLNRLEIEGALPSRVFSSTKRVHGYWDNKLPKTKVTSLVLNLLLDSGIIRVVRREGSERFFDLTHRTVPMELQHMAKKFEVTTANEALLHKYLRAYRVFDTSDSRFGWQKMSASERRTAITQRVETGTVIPLQIEGVKRQYYILASDLDKLQKHESTKLDDNNWMEGTIRFLPPLDSLLWRRERVVDLFNFSYKWEIYTPKEKRQYGYYTMPILAGDRLIGRIDPRLDRAENRLHINLLQVEPDIKLTKQLRKKLENAIESFATFHKAEEIVTENSYSTFSTT
jgi:uncharacterized protein YcaQ